MLTDERRRWIKKRLSEAVRNPGPRYAFDYGNELISAAESSGLQSLTREEANLAAAVAIDQCMQSGGAASCFQYAAAYLPRAEEAMNMIGLPHHASCTKAAFATLTAEQAATPENIRAFFHSLLGGADWDAWTASLDPVEEVYHDHSLAAVGEAVSDFIAKNHALLSERYQ